MDLVAREVEIREKCPLERLTEGVQKESPPEGKGDPKVRSHISNGQSMKTWEREGGKTIELVHTMQTLNFSLYSLN